jgi:tRNA A-37 threonylcarbamoyl transferase component Bud32
MPCRVRYLNSAGVQQREVKGLAALTATFPSKWLVYASFQYLPPRDNPLEIDAMVVMDDRILLLELKDWNGVLTCNGDTWLLDDRPRGRSPVDSVAHKARVLAHVIRTSIPGLQVYVDSAVVLTGTADATHLPPDQAARSWSLDQARMIADQQRRRQLLKPQKLLAKKPFEFEAELDKLTAMSRRFKPLETDWDGYRVVAENIFNHPKGIWSEHRAILKQDSRHGALLRTWAFDHLPPGLNTPATRRQVADRELHALQYLTEVRSSLVSRGEVLQMAHGPKPEILTHHFDLRRLAKDWFQLPRFLERAGDGLSFGDRIAIAQTLLNIVAELHQQGIAHRDLGSGNVWLGATTLLAVTSFAAAHLPNEQSVEGWRKDLAGYAPTLPEDRDPKSVGTMWQRDVFGLGVLCHEILLGRSPVDPNGVVVPDLAPTAPSEDIRNWLGTSLATDPSNRFADAQVMADQFGGLIDTARGPKVDQSILDLHEKQVNPFFEWPLESRLSSGRCEVYTSRAKTGEEVVVKVWPHARRGLNTETDLAIIRLLVGASKLKAGPVAGLPSCLDFGLTNVGTYVVYVKLVGATLKDSDPLEAPTALTAASKILVASNELHRLSLTHGDLNDQNVILSPGSPPGVSVGIVDLFDISLSGEGHLRSVDYLPRNWERLTEDQIDRFAAVQLVRVLLVKSGDRRLGECIEKLNLELERPAIETLDPILDLIKATHDQLEAALARRVRITLADQPPHLLRSDDGAFYVRAIQLTAGPTQYQITGVDERLTVTILDQAVRDVQLAPIDFDTLRRETRIGERMIAEIEVRRGPTNLDDLLARITTVQPLEDIREPDSDDTIEQPPIEETIEEAELAPGRIDTSEYWLRLIELEQNLVPELKLTSDVVEVGAAWIARYERTRGDFDYDPEDRVELRLPERTKRIAWLDPVETDDARLVMKELEWALRKDDTVQLVERRQRTSYDRRKRAITRVVDRRAPIEDLIDYFDVGAAAASIDFGINVAPEALEEYGLNNGQKRTFTQLARYGPVGLVQGPPGTGKTLFIAAFVHWLVTQQATERILIASQSHEAVNNVIDAILKLFRRLGTRPDLLRIGSKNITASARPFLTVSLRQRYSAAFLNAFRSRVPAIGSSAGMKRAFVEDSVEIDRALGQLVRRMKFREEVAELEDDTRSQADRRREDATDRVIERAFRKAGTKVLGRDADDAAPERELDAAYQQLLQRHAGSTLNDAVSVRMLLSVAREWDEALGSRARNFEEFLAKTKTIVTGTCVGLGQARTRIDQIEYDWVIVDEAARCNPGELAVPIQLGRRVVLVGDHFQLRPMVDETIIRDLQRELPHVPAAELLRSEFERAFVSGYGKRNGQILTEQYRMAEPICELVSEVFYKPHGVELITSPQREGDPFFSQESLHPLERAITWIDTSKSPAHIERPGQYNRWSFWNSAEIDAVMALLGKIAANVALSGHLMSKSEEHPIGIICMYDAQRDYIDRRIAQSNLPAKLTERIRVDNVDSYQGKENTIVIVSLVRCSIHQKPDRRGPKIGHVRSPNRCNVALSRAKERVVIVGARSFWDGVKGDAPMTAVLRKIELVEQMERGSSRRTARIVNAGSL